MILFQAFDEFEEFIPFFFEKVNGDVPEFDVISCFSIRFVSFPNQVIFGL
jgi:hypothetical protein